MIWTNEAIRRAAFQLAAGVFLALILHPAQARADDWASGGPVVTASPSPSPSPPEGGKSVTSKLQPEEPKSRPVGVRAQDPSEKAKQGFTTSPSLSNSSSMGIGFQFDLNPPKKPPEKQKGDRDADDEDQ